MWIQMSDDEKFLVKPDMNLEDAQRWTEDNVLDIIALGFDPKKTHIFVDTKNAKTMYPHAVRVAKHLNLSTAKAVFGFGGETNVGLAFYTAMQSVLAFLPSALSGKQIPCLVPLGLDQDPHFRVSRDILPKLGYHKPAVLHAKFLSGLGEGGKMSASLPNSAIYLTDSEKVVSDKIKKHAFSGGQKTAEEQRKLGANPQIDVSYQWLQAFFEEDDARINQIHDDYKSGKLLTSELKQILIDKVNAFLSKHREEREKAKDKIDKFLWKD
jgi:tryptophanyl-tRNA synthetase